MATSSKAVPEAEEQPKRYAAYDGTYLRFIGRVQDTEKAVKEQPQFKAAKEAGRELEVREV